MEDISLHKAELRQKERELRNLLNEWDPIGVVPGGPFDEYDCMLPVLGKLYHGASEAEIGAYFEEQLKSHFGLDPKPSRAASIRKEGVPVVPG